MNSISSLLQATALGGGQAATAPLTEEAAADLRRQIDERLRQAAEGAT